MQVNYHGDMSRLFSKASVKDAFQAVEWPEVRSVTLHKPGERVTVAGRTYRVDENGAYRRLDGKPRRRRTRI